jgi:ribonuclease HI
MGIGILACMQLSKKEYRISKYIGKGTNNIAELTAIKVALQKLSKYKSTRIIIHTDSRYCQGVLTLGWKAKANKELIFDIKSIMMGFEHLEIEWVRAHNGDAGNEIADSLALAARKNFENKSK